MRWNGNVIPRQYITSCYDYLTKFQNWRVVSTWRCIWNSLRSFNANSYSNAPYKNWTIHSRNVHNTKIRWMQTVRWSQMLSYITFNVEQEKEPNQVSTSKASTNGSGRIANMESHFTWQRVWDNTTNGVWLLHASFFGIQEKAVDMYL